MVEVRKAQIVVGIDGSLESLAALRWALAEGASSGRTVEVVHCSKPQTVADVLLATPHELRNASMVMVQNEVRAALSEIRDKPEVIETSVHGNPAGTLIDRSVGAAALVLGAHNRTVLKDLVLGGVARACLRHARCPVVIIDRAGQPIPSERTVVSDAVPAHQEPTCPPAPVV